ncbi:MAG: DUF2169 domain-containing protein [Polyangiaceae bacterium]|nr:DUF2169 domain-containing protein [Polyangiaceae bacterium]
MALALEVLPFGPVAVAARAWRHRQRRLFTVVVKATLRIQPDAPMAVVQPAPIVVEERHYRGNPVASLVRGSDLALTVPRPEVVVVGSAYAGAGQTTTQTTVRLAVQRASTILINKRLEIMGDRRARPGATAPLAKPFESMPIIYERALGGMSSRENPVGIGMDVDADGMLMLPNVMHATQGGAGPAGMGPIPSVWPMRQSKRGSMTRSHANQGPDVEVPDDFDDAYYQTAPSDQQTQELLPGDVIAIVNMHPELGLLRTSLPAARGVAIAQTSRGDRIPLSLRIDTVHLEPDTLRADIVFRGASLIDERDLAGLRIAGALEAPEVPFSFPDLSTVAGFQAQRAKSTAQPSFGTTAVISEPEAARGGGSLPFEGSVAGGDRAGRAGTMVLEPEPIPEPVRRQPPPPATVAAAPQGILEAAPRRASTMLIEVESDRRTSTMVLEPEPAPRHSTMVIEPDEAPKSLPFDRSRQAPRATSPTTKEGTPWADRSAAQLAPASMPGPDTRPIFNEDTAPISDMADEETTVAPARLEAPMSVPPPPPPPPRAVEPPPVEARPAAPPPSPPAKNADPWAKELDTPAPVMPPKPKPAARASLKQDLYKKLKR